MAGLPVLSPEDCECSLGHGYDAASAACEPCRQGEYKAFQSLFPSNRVQASVGDGICSKCPAQMSTLGVGATTVEECRCEAGLFQDDTGACATCPAGFYCPGTGAAVLCPLNSTTVTVGRQKSDCICLPGYHFASPELWCEPCQRRRYKPNLGNGECALTCPTNADSEVASTSLDDCYCVAEHHAMLDSAGKLASCQSCSYEGLGCKGGFESMNLTGLDPNATLPRVHSQPLALQLSSKLRGPHGFSHAARGRGSTRRATPPRWSATSCCPTAPVPAVEVSSVWLDGWGSRRPRAATASSVPWSWFRGSVRLRKCLCRRRWGWARLACWTCLTPGATGTLCGECPARYARENYPELCQACPLGASGALVAS